MINLIPFGEGFRRPAPARWGCTNLDAAPILADPLLVVHHYRPSGPRAARYNRLLGLVSWLDRH